MTRMGRGISKNRLAGAMLTLMLMLLGNVQAASSAGEDGNGSELILSEKLMKVTRNAGVLSRWVMGEKFQDETVNWDSLDYYEAELDAAAVAKKGGYCYVAFRGTTWNWPDWKQNFRISNEKVCVKQQGSGKRECCDVHQGFYEAYHAPYEEELVENLRNCAEQCEYKDECVVITGHSQGAAIAAIAALYLSDLDPYVITFGQPAAIDAPCSLVNSERWYRWINTKASKTMSFGIVYDPVPFVNNFAADNFGHTILLSEDDTGIAYIGLDVEDFFLTPNVYGFQSHSLRSRGSDYPGYLDRIDSLIQYGQFPVRTSGYKSGSLCSLDSECESRACDKDSFFDYKKCSAIECRHHSHCSTGRCDAGLCVPKAASCEECVEHSDCASGHCSWSWVCTGDNGLMDNGCTCNYDIDCKSLRCEGPYFRSVCEARLGIGVSCNENSDCSSGRCSWAFRCAEPRWGRRLSSWQEERELTMCSVTAFVVLTAFAAIVGVAFDRFRRRGIEN